MTSQLINCTPHPVNIYAADGEILILEMAPSGVLPRLTEEITPLPSLKTKEVEIICVSKKYTAIENLPPKEEGVILIVSFMVLDAGKKLGRNDLVAPDTGPESCVRENGRILGCRRFQR